MLQWKNKSARVSGWQTGRGKMTAVQRNQIKTDNKLCAEEACGHWAGVRELPRTTITHSASVGFICSVCRFPILVCIAPSHFFFYSLSSSQTLLRLPFSIWVFSIYFRLHFLFFLSSVWHTLTFRCLLDCLSGSLFLLIFSLLSCLTLSRPYSVTFVWRNKVTVWEMEFLAFSSKGFDKKDGHCCHDCWLNMEQQLEVRKKHSLA